MSARRKSCKRCIAGKRRCDLRLPCCSRCVASRLNCEYPVTVTRKDALARNEYSLRQSAEAVDAWDTTLRSLFTDHNNSSASPPLLSPFDNQNIIHIDHPASHNNHHHHYFPTSTQSLPSPIPSLIPPPLVFLPRTRISYGITHLLAYITSFATTGHTPFVNPHAFTTYTQSSVTPTPLLDAFCVTAAYTFSSPKSATRVMALSAIAGKAAALVEPRTAREREPTRTSSSECRCSAGAWDWDWPMTMPLEDLLANVQALLLYQIVQLFDGDIAARCMAERHESVLASWTRILARRHATEPGHEPLTVPTAHIPSTPALSPSSSSSSSFPSPSSPFDSPSAAAALDTETESSPWRAWLLSESIRRTVIVEMMLRGIYHATKEGCCNVVHSLARLPLTDRGKLWDVKTEWEWDREVGVGVERGDCGGGDDGFGGESFGADIETQMMLKKRKSKRRAQKMLAPRALALVGYQEMVEMWSKERDGVWTEQRDGLQILLLKMCKGSAEEGVA